MAPEVPAASAVAAGVATPPALSRIGFDVLLVGDGALTGRLAAALLGEEEDAAGTGNTLAAPPPAAVALLRRRLEWGRGADGGAAVPPPSSSSSSPPPSWPRRIHLADAVEQIDAVLRATDLDHIVLVAPVCEARPAWRRDLWTALTLEPVPPAFTLQDRVTLVAVPTPEAPDAAPRRRPPAEAPDREAPAVRVPVLVCRLAQRESRKHVAAMLWRRIAVEPCTRLATLQLQ